LTKHGLDHSSDSIQFSLIAIDIARACLLAIYT
jgi:hypothetical protein